mgnify:CR=1 FL=1
MTIAVLDAPELFTREQAADYLGVKTQTLSLWACTGRYDLPFIKVGRSVRYKRADLDAFLDSRRVTHLKQLED